MAVAVGGEQLGGEPLTFGDPLRLERDGLDGYLDTLEPRGKDWIRSTCGKVRPGGWSVQPDVQERHGDRERSGNRNYCYHRTSCVHCRFPEGSADLPA